MIAEVILFLLLLNIKHLIVDFYLQTDDMVRGKGIYGDVRGVNHSFQHFLGTWAVSLSMIHIFAPSLIANNSFAEILFIIIGIPLIDGIIHYHIDWLKMRMERDITKKEFWRSLGCDQFLHQATYLILAIIIFT